MKSVAFWGRGIGGASEVSIPGSRRIADLDLSGLTEIQARIGYRFLRRSVEPPGRHPRRTRSAHPTAQQHPQPSDPESRSGPAGSGTLRPGTVSGMGRLRVDQVNVVLAEVDAAADFLAGLGLEMPAPPPGWGSHHRSLPMALPPPRVDGDDEPPVAIELDSVRFAQRWGGLRPPFSGVVLNVRVDERDEVDRLHDVALFLGATSLTRPYDAFWGSRFAVVEGPGPLVVGLLSVPDENCRSAPPDPDSLV